MSRGIRRAVSVPNALARLVGNFPSRPSPAELREYATLLTLESIMEVENVLRAPAFHKNNEILLLNVLTIKHRREEIKSQSGSQNENKNRNLDDPETLTSTTVCSCRYLCGSTRRRRDGREAWSDRGIWWGGGGRKGWKGNGDCSWMIKPGGWAGGGGGDATSCLWGKSPFINVNQWFTQCKSM